MLFDQSVFVQSAITSVLREGAIAAGLTALMILIFLGSWRSTLIVMVSIPLSILTSIAVMWALGQTINTTEQQGQSNYLALLAANPSAPIYDMSGQLVSPATYASTAAANLPSTGTGGGGGGGTRIGGGNPVGATPAQNNNVPYGGGYPGGAGQYSTAPTSVLDSLYASSYIPGGSSPFGLISTGGGNTVDMFDPLAGSAAGLPTYGTMPDYSQPGTDPIAAALGMGPSGLPANTVYSPTTDTYDYTYGVPSYYSSSGPSYYSGGGGGDYSDLGDYYGP